MADIVSLYFLLCLVCLPVSTLGICSNLFDDISYYSTKIFVLTSARSDKSASVTTCMLCTSSTNAFSAVQLKEQFCFTQIQTCYEVVIWRGQIKSKHSEVLTDCD